MLKDGEFASKITCKTKPAVTLLKKRPQNQWFKQLLAQRRTVTQTSGHKISASIGISHSVNTSYRSSTFMP